MIQYNNYLKDNSQTNKKILFLALKSLALSVLNTKYKKLKIDRDSYSYEYAVSLFIRILSGEFKPHATFPWREYVSLNIKSILFPYVRRVPEAEAIKQFYNYIEEDSPQELKYLHYELAEQIYLLLLLYYSKEEINRLYPMAREFIPDMIRGRWNIKNRISKPIRKFISILSGCARWACQTKNVHHSLSFTKSLNTSVNSSILMSVIGMELLKKCPPEFVLSLDLESLKRVSIALGGKTIRIPTIDELNDLSILSSSISKVLLEGKDRGIAVQESLAKMSSDFKKKYSFQSYLNLVEKCLPIKNNSNMDVIVGLPSLGNQLLLNLDRLKNLTNKFKEHLNKRTLKELINNFDELNNLINNIEGEFKK